ncbi:hypothetical protein V8C86DRAFT_2471492 [Haematococcus lacustris]
MLSCCWRSSNVTQPLVRKSPEATDIQQLLNPLQGIQQANVQEKDNELWDECLDALECVESFEEQEESDDEVENAGVRQLASETTRHNIERKLRQERRLQQKRLAEELNACQRAKSQGMLTLDRKPSQLVSRSGRSALSHGMLLEACSHSVAHEPSPSADVVMQLSLASLPSKPTVGYKVSFSNVRPRESLAGRWETCGSETGVCSGPGPLRGCVSAAQLALQGQPHLVDNLQHGVLPHLSRTRSARFIPVLAGRSSVAGASAPGAAQGVGGLGPPLHSLGLQSGPRQWSRSGLVYPLPYPSSLANMSPSYSHTQLQQPHPVKTNARPVSGGALPRRYQSGPMQAQESMGTLEHGPAQALPHPSPLKDDEDRVWQQVLRLKQEWRDEAAG